MNKSASCTRSKPPPVRGSSFNSFKGRSYVNSATDRLNVAMQGFNG